MNAKQVITANETYKNWKSFAQNEPCAKMIEARLYTDARIMGELPSLGPYSFLNTIAGARSVLRPAIVLRIAIHAHGTMPSIPMTDDFQHYHGGDRVDEMAAVASLGLGIRLRAGHIDREFIPGGDRYGKPLEIETKARPALPPPAYHRAQIPGLGGDRNLSELKVLESFPARTASEANAFIKAARMYQQAVWVADADPGLAWLFLISAVETVAVAWAGEEGCPRDQLEASFPEVFRLLQETPCAHLIDPIAGFLSEITKATKKFIDFLLKFAPEPPKARPHLSRFSFKRGDLKHAASIIYGHRSASLHSGTAFPLPMCEPPKLYSEDAAYEEVPSALAMSAYGATWRRKTTPMLLHTFEYIARGALLGWWKSLDVRH